MSDALKRVLDGCVADCKLTGGFDELWDLFKNRFHLVEPNRSVVIKIGLGWTFTIRLVYAMMGFDGIFLRLHMF